MTRQSRTILYHAAEDERARRMAAAGVGEQDETENVKGDRCGVLLSKKVRCWDDIPNRTLLTFELPLSLRDLEVYAEPDDQNTYGRVYWVPAVRCRGTEIEQLRGTLGRRSRPRLLWSAPVVRSGGTGTVRAQIGG